MGKTIGALKGNNIGVKVPSGLRVAEERESSNIGIKVADGLNIVAGPEKIIIKVFIGSGALVRMQGCSEDKIKCLGICGMKPI